jgi:hypothetical protein
VIDPWATALHGTIGTVGPPSDRPLRSRLFLSRLYRLTFGWSTRSRLANPLDFPRANDLGMSRLVHLFHQTKIWFRRFGRRLS